MAAGLGRLLLLMLLLLPPLLLPLLRLLPSLLLLPPLPPLRLTRLSSTGVEIEGVRVEGARKYWLSATSVRTQTSMGPTSHFSLRLSSCWD